MSEAYENDMAAEQEILDRIAAAEPEPEEATDPRQRGRRLGRPKKIDARGVARWRRTNGASIAQTAEHFGISPRAVSKASAEHKEAVRLWIEDREDQDWRQLDAASELLTMKIRKLKEAGEEADRIREAHRNGEASYEDVLDAMGTVRFWASSVGAFNEGRDSLWRS